MASSDVNLAIRSAFQEFDTHAEISLMKVLAGCYGDGFVNAIKDIPIIERPDTTAQDTQALMDEALRLLNPIKDYNEALASKLTDLVNQGIADGKDDMEIAADLRSQIPDILNNQPITIQREGKRPVSFTPESYADLIADTIPYSIRNEGYIQGLKRSGADGWISVATGDERMCEYCGDKDGQVFGFDDEYPPYHNRCKCRPIAYFRPKTPEEEEESKRLKDLAAKKPWENPQASDPYLSSRLKLAETADKDASEYFDWWKSDKSKSGSIPKRDLDRKKTSLARAVSEYKEASQKTISEVYHPQEGTIEEVLIKNKPETINKIYDSEIQKKFYSSIDDTNRFEEACEIHDKAILDYHKSLTETIENNLGLGPSREDIISDIKKFTAYNDDDRVPVDTLREIRASLCYQNSRYPEMNKILRTPKIEFNYFDNTYAATSSETVSGKNIIRFNLKDTVDHQFDIFTDLVSSYTHPEYCESYKSVVDHELGHSLDYKLGISDDSKIKSLFDSYVKTGSQKDLAQYAKKNIREFVAEGWAEYLNSPNPRPLSRQIGEIVEQYLGSVKEFPSGEGLVDIAESGIKKSIEKGVESVVETPAKTISDATESITKKVAEKARNEAVEVTGGAINPPSPTKAISDLAKSVVDPSSTNLADFGISETNLETVRYFQKGEKVLEVARVNDYYMVVERGTSGVKYVSSKNLQKYIIGKLA